ncbi:MAG: glycosyltransferase family 2 protein [Sphaerospermopsis sp. SIO1G2]|nr:glycosyltransferase family 2 protein [Sphaerospermopsis sp. SIO1G1]NET73029.1 glycosyltransferase family 2 protein [Sphaerospermopsis sp. SIO1G2]
MSITDHSSQPLVSVIIPTYNRPEYLKQAIYSAVTQTYQNIEIIVSDNCSPESPQSLVESFADPRIRFWQHPENVGMLKNQMNAFQMANGKYVASLHDDDMWTPQFLAQLIPQLEQDSNLIIAFSDQYIIDSQGKIDNIKTEEFSRVYKRDQLSSGVYWDFQKIGLIDKSIPTASACVIRNGLIDWDSIPLEVGGMWDLYITYLCCVSGYGLYYEPEKLTYYRNHEQTDTNLSGSRNIKAKIRNAKSAIFCYQIFMDDPKIKNLQPHFRKLWLEAHTTLGIGLMRDQQNMDARSLFWQTLQEQKFNLRTFIALILSFIPAKFTNKLLGA